MCDDKYRMEQPLIDEMYDLVLKEEQEYCIIFSKDSNRTLRFSRESSVGKLIIENGKERASCIFPKHDKREHPYLFHSHPRKRRSYPSLEDVVKLLRHPEVFLSVIATRWGIYVIKSNHESREFARKYYKLDKNSQMKKYESKFGIHLKKIGFLENDKGYKNGEFPPLNEKEVDVISQHLEEIAKITGLEIKFCPWKDLNKNPM